MNIKKYSYIASVLAMGTIIFVQNSNGQISITPGSDFEFRYSATENNQTNEVVFSPEGITQDVTISLVNELAPLPVTFTGNFSNSWANALNWNGWNLAVTAGSVAINAVKIGGGSSANLSWRRGQEVFNAFGEDGGPTKKSISSEVEGL